MFKNYFLTAWRNLFRNRAYTLINLIGLSLGLACCLLIVLYVQDELAYDQFHEKKDRIYRVSAEMSMGGNADHYAMTSMAVGPQITERYPEVDTFARFMHSSNDITVRYEQQMYNEGQIYIADPQVLDVFSFPLVAGDPRTALSGPGMVVLTERLAQKYFGSDQALGKRIKLNTTEYEVTGVMKNLPTHTDFPVNGLISVENLPDQTQQVMNWDWGRIAFFTFIVFKKPEQAIGFEAKLEEFVAERVIPFWEENGIKGEMIYHLTALPALHFRTDMSYDTPKGNRNYLYVFSIVALFILLIACFNYINLAIAQSAKRSVEVGVRKATGAARGQLIGQFMGESFLLTLLALLLAIIWVELALPWFNQVAGKSFSASIIFQPIYLLSMLAVAILAGLLAGGYPALFLASLKPVDVLKGKLTLKGKQSLRKVLVVLQFSISIALIIGTLVVREQMSYMKDRDLGFEKDQTLIVQVPWDTTVQNRLPLIQEELLRHPAVEKVAASRNGLPGMNTGALLMRVEQDGQLHESQFNISFIDDRYLPTLGIEVLEGRNFDASRGTESQQAFIVNEAFVREQGWENAIGKRMQWGLQADNQAAYDGAVIGVVKDYHYASLHNSIDPIVLLYAPANFNRLILTLDGRQVSEGLAYVNEVWQARDPNHPMEYFFLDNFFDQQYEREARLMELFSFFSLLTIAIACMGLFGLASYITQQRTKEIGIRKVLGADRGQILWLIFRDFALLVGIAVVLASVGSWVSMKSWLTGFAFAVPMPVYAYLLAGFIAFMIALLATSYHTLRVVKANPAHALRYE